MEHDRRSEAAPPHAPPALEQQAMGQPKQNTVGWLEAPQQEDIHIPGQLKAGGAHPFWTPVLSDECRLN